MTEAHYHQSAIEKDANDAVWAPRLEALREREKELLKTKDQGDVFNYFKTVLKRWEGPADYETICLRTQERIAYLESLPDYEPFVVAETPDRQPSPGCALAIVAAVFAFTIVTSILLFRIFP